MVKSSSLQKDKFDMLSCENVSESVFANVTFPMISVIYF